MSETIKDQEISSEQGIAGRRRLVRGAMALAPLVLTLRSGALAAASCTGSKLITTTDSNASIKETTARDSSFVVSPDPFADKCVEINDSDTDINLCPENKIVTRPHTEMVTLEKNQDVYYCGQGSGKIKGKRVAILSSSSASSLTGG